MKQKPVAENFRGTVLGRAFQSKAGVILSNWVFQGMRQMNVYEIGLKLILDAALTLVLVYLVFDPPSVDTLILSFITAHTLNWIFNGHIYVLWRYVRPVPTSKEKFQDFVQHMARDTRHSRLDGIAIFGSYCRGRLHSHSDLDVRFVVQEGIVNGMAGAAYCFSERLAAFFRRFPLDIYCCVGMNGMERLREDEIPVVLLDRSGALGRRYPASLRKADEYAR